MTAAIALAIVVAIAVAGASMAMESQRADGAPAQPIRRPMRPPGPPSAPRRPRARDRMTGRADPTNAPAPPPPPGDPEPGAKAPELVRNGVQAEARVISVVDERTIGPVTRSRLNLSVEPDGKDPFEVTIRWAFQTPESRAKVRVGGKIPVRYDPDDTNRVVVDLPQD